MNINEYFATKGASRHEVDVRTHWVFAITFAISDPQTRE